MSGPLVPIGQGITWISHEMIKRQNKKLESELEKMKQKYENDLSQMRSSQAQLKSLILKNSF